WTFLDNAIQLQVLAVRLVRDQIVGVVKLGINGLFSCKCYKREMNLWCALLWVMLQDQFSNIDFRNWEWPRGFMEQKTHKFWIVIATPLYDAGVFSPRSLGHLRQWQAADLVALSLAKVEDGRSCHYDDWSEVATIMALPWLPNVQYRKNVKQSLIAYFRCSTSDELVDWQQAPDVVKRVQMKQYNANRKRGQIDNGKQ